MAKSEQWSHSVFGASDEVPDIYCEPCHQAEHVAIAEGYCVDCPEYLCGPCYKSHRHHKALANHVLLGKGSMPIIAESSRSVVDDCEAKCPTHPNKVIELFCKTCDKFVCHICVALDHNQCKKVKHIPDIVKYLENTKEFKKFVEYMKKTASELSALQNKLQAYSTSNQEMRTLAKQVLKRQSAEVNNFFYQLEKKMDDQIAVIEERNRDLLEAASDRLDQMKTDYDQIKKDMDIKNTGQMCSLFIAMKQRPEKISTFHDQFNRMKGELRIQHYTLVPSEQIQAMMRTTTEICRIATARFESEIDITTGEDRRKPLIYDLSIMHGHYCVTADYNNRCIKVIDTNTKCVISVIGIKAMYICSMTSVGDDQVAVSVAWSGLISQLQFFTVSTSGVIQRTNKVYDVEDRYNGMVYYAGNIYGAKYDRIDKLDLEGAIIRTIDKPEIKDSILISEHPDKKSSVETIAVSPDGQTLYVSYTHNRSITSMTLDGEVKAVFKDKELKEPRGITVDKHGYVYVCSCDKKNIQQFTADLNKVQVLVGAYGDAITYSSNENKLFIGVGNKIHLYSLNFQ